MNKKLIAENFSRYAHLYDSYANIQRYTAVKLIKEIGEGKYRDILEPGCGTGNYTRLLRGFFPSSGITSVDISKQMVRIAKKKLQGRGIKFSICDAENENFRAKYDLITSNASLQWFDDFALALRRYRGFLKDRGELAFSMFGPETFSELNRVLENIFRKSSVVASRGFIGKREIRDVLKENYGKIRIKEEILEEEYPSLKHLFEKIKYTGERGEGASGEMFFSPGKFRKAGELYAKKYGGIKATYQVFYCRASV